MIPKTLAAVLLESKGRKLTRWMRGDVADVMITTEDAVSRTRDLFVFLPGGLPRMTEGGEA